MSKIMLFHCLGNFLLPHDSGSISSNAIDDYKGNVILAYDSSTFIVEQRQEWFDVLVATSELLELDAEDEKQMERPCAINMLQAVRHRIADASRSAKGRLEEQRHLVSEPRDVSETLSNMMAADAMKRRCPSCIEPRDLRLRAHVFKDGLRTLDDL